MRWTVTFPQGHEFNGFSALHFEPADTDNPQEIEIRCLESEHVPADLPPDATWDDVPAMLDAWYPNGEISIEP
jgi:hypothetical protein